MTGPISHRQRGIGLTEIMIALVLGLLVIGAVTQLYLTGKRSFTLQQSLTSRQEAARFAVDILQADLQIAGYRGCMRDAGTVRNTLNSTAHPWDFGTHLQGFDAVGAGWAPGLPAGLPAVLPGTDVLTVRSVDDPNVFITAAMPSSSADLKTTAGLNPAPFVNGDIVLVTDCGGAAVLQITNYTVASGNVVHNTGGTWNPGNATKDLGRRFEPGAQVLALRTTNYFVAAGATGPALWRQNGLAPAQELASGVENMQVRYGQDNDGDRSPDAYLTAAAVTDWDDVVSAEIALLVAGAGDLRSEPDPRTFDLLGQVVGPFSDGRARAAMTFTVALRNHLP